MVVWQVDKCFVTQSAEGQWEWMPEESQLIRWQEKSILSNYEDFN